MSSFLRSAVSAIESTVEGVFILMYSSAGGPLRCRAAVLEFDVRSESIE